MPSKLIADKAGAHQKKCAKCEHSGPSGTPVPHVYTVTPEARRGVVKSPAGVNGRLPAAARRP